MSETVGLIGMSIVGEHPATNQTKSGYDPVVRASARGSRKTSQRPSSCRIVRRRVEGLNGAERGAQRCPRGGAGKAGPGRSR